MDLDLLGGASFFFKRGAQIVEGKITVTAEDGEQRDLSEEELQQVTEKAIEIRDKNIATQYQKDRASAYPSLGDQLDMIFHAGLGGDEFQAAIAAIKADHPKPE